jgi:hypothetical protein
MNIMNNSFTIKFLNIFISQSLFIGLAFFISSCQKKEMITLMFPLQN